MPVTTRNARPTVHCLATALALLPCLGASAARVSLRKPDIRYAVTVDEGDTTGFAVEMRLRGVPDTFTLTWVRHPEYDDRFWRYVERMRAEPATATGRASVTLVPCAAAITPCDSARWRVATTGGAATLRWRLRVPFERRPRGAWRPFIAPTGALLGGPHTFPMVEGLERAPAHVTLALPSGWHVATTLPRDGEGQGYLASDVAQLVESPILAGRLREWTFDVKGVPHRVAWWPRPDALAFDTATFVSDLARVAAQADTLFGGMPYREFAFLFQDDAYGGLEHPASVTLGVTSDELARDPHAAIDEAAHEYIHTWNMMAIRPAEYGAPTWRAVQPVATLWFGEGLTMYYADALVRRAWIRRDGETRVAHLESLVRGNLANPAYTRFSPVAISLLEYNAGPEALGDYTASVHQVGELVGTALDLMIRERTSGRRSMDDVMRLLYRESRGVTHVATNGIGNADIERAVESVCACDATPFFDAHVRGTTPVDMARWLHAIGMELTVTHEAQRNEDGTPVADWRVWAYNPYEGAPLRLRLQTPASVWGRAGLHTGDLVTSINGTPVHTWPEFRGAVSTLQVGDSVRVTIDASGSAPARTVHFTMEGYERPMAHIRPASDATPVQRALGERWVAGW